MKDRLIGTGKVSTVVGTTLGAAVAGATAYGQSSGWNFSSWQGYAAAAAVAAVGALWKGKVNTNAPKQQAAPPLSPLDAHRAEQLAKIDAAITEAGMKAMEAKAGEVG